jgi:outer membrane protein assembly factor BamB
MNRFSLLLLIAATAWAGDWVTGGGNAWRSGLSDERGPARREDLAWEGTEAGIFGAPIYIWDNKLVTMRFQTINYAPIVCHDLATGETLWTHDFPGTNSRSLPIGFRDGRVYAINFQERTNERDTLYALDATDGHVIWRGQVQTWMSITESATFAENGDLIVSADSFRLARVDCTTGGVVWTTPRVWPVTGSADACVYDSTVYAFSGDIGSLYVNAWDLATGRFKYKTRLVDTHPGGPLPQSAPMVGDDGTIYAHKPGDNVTALEDTGDSLRALWTHEVSGGDSNYSIFSHFAVGPDRSVYCASDGRIQRLDPATGVCLDSSPFIKDPTSIYFGARMAIGADSLVYLTTGTYNSALYALTRDLQILWADSLPNMNTSGPAIGNGFLAVSGAGSALKVYHNAVAVSEREPAGRQQFLLQATPGPGGTRLRFANPVAGAVTISVFDAAGRLLARAQSFRPAGTHEFSLPRTPSGVAFATVTSGNQIATVKFTQVR